MNSKNELRRDGTMIDLAREIHRRAEKRWGPEQAVVLIGQHYRFAEALDRVARLAAADVPVLITGETGTGKELFARTVFLLGRSHQRVFLPVNCGQYTNEDVMVSELFGHRKGSFTGATTEHRGIFEDADGGTVFLDEVGELTARAQVMLLRLLGEGEVVAVGATQPRRVLVRVVAATNRDLLAMVHSGEFRADLYFRLQRLKVRVPPLRERGRDWRLIADHFLDRLTRRTGTTKRLGPGTVARLDRYPWRGNVREVQGCIETGFYSSRGSEITFADCTDAFETAQPGPRTGDTTRFFDPSECCSRMERGEGSFWNSVYEPYMARDLNRGQVREVIAEGLVRAEGSYKRLLRVLGIPEWDYLKFMDFLRYHRLKPDPRWRHTLVRGELAHPICAGNGD